MIAIPNNWKAMIRKFIVFSYSSFAVVLIFTLLYTTYYMYHCWLSTRYLAPLERFELPTFGFEDRNSIQLSYRGFCLCVCFTVLNLVSNSIIASMQRQPAVLNLSASSCISSLDCICTQNGIVYTSSLSSMITMRLLIFLAVYMILL